MTDITRTKFASITNLGVTFRKPVPTRSDAEQNAYSRGDILIVRKDNGAIVGTVNRDDLFDKHGNRFDYD